MCLEANHYMLSLIELLLLRSMHSCRQVLAVSVLLFLKVTLIRFIVTILMGYWGPSIQGLRHASLLLFAFDDLLDEILSMLIAHCGRVKSSDLRCNEFAKRQTNLVYCGA
jgi:hypothetical protein